MAAKWLGWPKWLKSLGTVGTSAFPILFTKLFWKMAKKFKNFGVLGCLIAVEEMADFTLWFQQKYDFFGTSSVLTLLVALKTQPNLWKQLSICQCTSQGPKVTKSELFKGFKKDLSTLNDNYQQVNGVKKWVFASFFIFLPFNGFRSKPKCVTTSKHITKHKKGHKMLQGIRSLWSKFSRNGQSIFHPHWPCWWLSSRVLKIPLKAQIW